MSATERTPNYELPVYAPSDSTTWADFNLIAEKLDTILKTINDLSTTASELANTANVNANEAKALATKIETDLITLDADVKDIESVLLTVTQEIASLKVKTDNTDTTVGNILSADYQGQINEVKGEELSISIFPNQWNNGLVEITEATVKSADTLLILKPITKSTETKEIYLEYLSKLSSYNITVRDDLQTIGKFTLECLGDVPTETLNINVIVRGELNA